MLKKLGKGDYETVIIASSIIRPAAHRYVRLFIRRFRGERYRRLTLGLEETLKETCGLLVYQEDLYRVLIEVAGFSAGQADEVRRLLGSLDREESLRLYRDKFFLGGEARGGAAGRRFRFSPRM